MILHPQRLLPHICVSAKCTVRSLCAVERCHPLCTSKAQQQQNQIIRSISDASMKVTKKQPCNLSHCPDKVAAANLPHSHASIDIRWCTNLSIRYSTNFLIMSQGPPSMYVSKLNTRQCGAYPTSMKRTSHQAVSLNIQTRWHILDYPETSTDVLSY